MEEQISINWDVEQLEPLFSPYDPDTVKKAGTTIDASVAVKRGACRCGLILAYQHDGLISNHEMGMFYQQAFPYYLLRCGIVNIVQHSTRQFDRLKGNDHPANKLHENLDIVERSNQVRPHTMTGNDNILFKYRITPPEWVLNRWRWGARGQFKKISDTRLDEDIPFHLMPNEQALHKMAQAFLASPSYQFTFDMLMTKWEKDNIVSWLIEGFWSEAQMKKVFELFYRCL